MVTGTDTGLKDKNGSKILSGMKVCLGFNITADDSMGYLPNGWTFDETDVYEVFWDERVTKDIKWALKLDCEPDSAYNVKYMNHANSLLYDCKTEIVT